MKKLLATLALLAIVGDPAARAAQITARNYNDLARINLPADHARLAHQVIRTGLTFKVNPADCWEDDAYGWYWAAKNEMVICQENKTVPGQVTWWTEEDLDTLRHEAHHVVQDCRDGALRGDLDAVYKEPVKMAVYHLGEDYAHHIAKIYGDQGKHTVVMELEAFTVATMNDTAEQVQDFGTFCF